MLESPLGTVGLAVSRTEAGLHLVLSAASAQARALLEQGLGQLQTRLEQLGCGFVGAEVSADGRQSSPEGRRQRRYRRSREATLEAVGSVQLGYEPLSVLNTLV